MWDVKKMQKKLQVRCMRTCAIISIALLLGMSFSPITNLISNDARGDKYIPPRHKSTDPVNNEWTLVGYKPLIIEEVGAHDQGYLALYVKETKKDHFVFMFEWLHSGFVSVIDDDGHECVPKKYSFCGAIFQTCKEDDPIWEVGPVERSNPGYGFVTSPEIEVKDVNEWGRMRFAGFLTACADISRAMWKRILAIAAVVVIAVGVFLVTTSTLGTATTAVIVGLAEAGIFGIACWVGGDEEKYSIYHAFSGHLCILYPSRKLIYVEASGEEKGYDLPNVIEDSTGRRDVGNLSIKVYCALPSKIHIDFFTRYRNNAFGDYDDQAETKIHCMRNKYQYSIIGGFPDRPETIMIPAWDEGKRAIIQWDLSQYFNKTEYGGLSHPDIRSYLITGTECDLLQFHYLGDIAVLSFKINFRIDYELPEDMMNYPLDPLASVHQYQLFGFYVDYYTWLRSDQDSKIKKDVTKTLDVYNGDESLPGLVLLPLVPVIIGYQMLKQSGLWIQTPINLDDFFILPPSPMDMIHDNVSNANDSFPVIKVEHLEDNMSDYVGIDGRLKRMPNHKIVVPDPRNTTFIMPKPGILPESIVYDPPDFAIDEDVYNWVYDEDGALEKYGDISEKLIDERKQYVAHITPGIPDPNQILKVTLPDIQTRYMIGILLPDGTVQELIIIHPPYENELSCVSIRNNPAYLLVPGSEAFSEGMERFTIDLPHGINSTMINIAKPTVEADYLSYLTLPQPENHLVISVDAMEDGYMNWVTMSILSKGTETPSRAFEDAMIDFTNETLCIGNLIQIYNGSTSVTTYSPEHSLDSPISSCELLRTPNGDLNDPLDNSGFLSAVDPWEPSYRISYETDLDMDLFKATLSWDPWNDGYLGLVVPGRTTVYDGIVFRGTASEPSMYSHWNLTAYIVSPHQVIRDSVTVNPWYWNYLYGTIPTDHDLPPGHYTFMIHHPGKDGEFFTIGSPESDLLFLKDCGAHTFADIAHSTTDDSFHISEITIEPVELNISSVSIYENNVTINGYCNRLDGVDITAILEDEDGIINIEQGITMFDRYAVAINVPELQDGIYWVTVMDDSGNMTQCTLEVNRGDGS